MHISSVSFFGIKGASTPRRLDIEPEVTVLCGKNDAGKSTVLEALDFFFNARTVEDAYVSRISKENSITPWVEVTFFDLPERIDLDQGATSSFLQEHLLTPEGGLCIRRTFSGSSPSTCIIAKHPVLKRDNRSLLEIKNSELKSLWREHSGSFPDLNPNQSKNPELRKALYQVSDLFEVRDKFIIPEGPDVKKILNAVDKLLPSYYLFKAEQVAGEAESFIQNPVSIVVKDVIAKHQQSLDNVADDIVKDIESSLHAVASELQQLVPSLSTSFKSDQVEPNWSKAFSKAAFVDENNVPIQARGSGMKRLAILSFFRANIAQSSQADENVIYAMEEPEVFLHPDLQIELWDSLMAQPEGSNAQVLVTTHSTNFIRNTPVSSVRYLEKGVTYSKESFSDLNSPSEAFVNLIENSMGLLSDNSVKVILLVEGPNDLASLVHLFSSDTLPESIDLQDAYNAGHIMILPIGGCGASKVWIDDRIIDPLRRPVILLLDGDDSPASFDPSPDLDTDGLVPSVVRLDCRELENLIPLDLAIENCSSAWGYEFEKLKRCVLDRLEGCDERRAWNVPYVLTASSYDYEEVDLAHVSEKSFSKKESKVKKRLANLFGDFEESDWSNVEESNLGGLLSAVRLFLTSSSSDSL